MPEFILIGSANTAKNSSAEASHPFAGWQFEADSGSASALVVEQPARKSWAATIWIWEKAAWPLVRWAATDDWLEKCHRLGNSVTDPGGGLSLTREGNMLRLHSERRIRQGWSSSAPSDIGTDSQSCKGDFAETASQYHSLLRIRRND